MKNVFLILLVAVLLVGTMGGTAMAMTVAMEKPPEEYSVDQVENVSVRGTATHIGLVGTTIADCGDRKVAFSAFTYAKYTVDYISGRVYLQRYEGGKWVNIASRLYYRFNYFFARGGSSMTVAPGFYRAHSIHYAELNGTSHSMSSTTAYRYVE